jgi:hypothetical protein
MNTFAEGYLFAVRDHPAEDPNNGTSRNRKEKHDTIKQNKIGPRFAAFFITFETKIPPMKYLSYKMPEGQIVKIKYNLIKNHNSFDCQVWVYNFKLIQEFEEKFKDSEETEYYFEFTQISKHKSPAEQVIIDQITKVEDIHFLKHSNIL